VCSAGTPLPPQSPAPSLGAWHNVMMNRCAEWGTDGVGVGYRSPQGGEVASGGGGGGGCGRAATHATTLGTPTPQEDPTMRTMRGAVRLDCGEMCIAAIDLSTRMLTATGRVWLTPSGTSHSPRARCSCTTHVEGGRALCMRAHI
jgi:hypothetical protein